MAKNLEVWTMTSGSFFVKEKIKYFYFEDIAWKIGRGDIFEEYCRRQWFGHVHRNQMLSRLEDEQISVKRPLMVKFARWNLDIDFKSFVENNKNRPLTGLISAHIFQPRENSRSRCGEKRTFAYLRLKQGLKTWAYNLKANPDILNSVFIISTWPVVSLYRKERRF